MADGASNKFCLASSTCQGETQQAWAHLHLRQKLSADAFSMPTVATAQSMSTLLLRGTAMKRHLWTPPPDGHRQVFSRKWQTATPTAVRSSHVPKASAADRTDGRRPHSKQSTFPARMDREKQGGQSEVHTVSLHGRNTVNCWCVSTGHLLRGVQNVHEEVLALNSQRQTSGDRQTKLLDPRTSLGV